MSKDTSNVTFDVAKNGEADAAESYDPDNLNLDSMSIHQLREEIQKLVAQRKQQRGYANKLNTKMKELHHELLHHRETCEGVEISLSLEKMKLEAERNTAEIQSVEIRRAQDNVTQKNITMKKQIKNLIKNVSPTEEINVFDQIFNFNFFSNFFEGDKKCV